MRSIRPSMLFALLSSFTAVACGGDGGSSPPVDAKIFLDGGTTPIDAPPSALTGLGQKCGEGLPACLASAPQCVGLLANGQGTSCTPKCLTGGSGTSNASGQLPLNMLTPAPNPAACTGAYTQTVGMPQCVVILATTPAHSPLMANTAYTGIELGCVVFCGANNTCPPGLAVNNSLGPCLCFPQ